MTTRFLDTRSGLQRSPWLILGSTVILMVVVLVLAIQNYNREKRYVSEILSEKGAALIRAVEAGARTGMRRMMWGDDLVQIMLEETARLPGVLYMALVDENGRIVAHSERDKVGEVFHRLLPVQSPQAETGQLVGTQVHDQAFEVYRQFRPWRPDRNMPPPDRASPMMRRHMSMMERQPHEIAKDNRVIVAGLDVTPFEEARQEDIRNTAIISAVLVLLGFGGFVSLFWAQSYRSAKRSLQDTSAFADEVVTHLPVGLIATDRDGRIAFFNGAAERITGIDRSKALGHPAEGVLPPNWCGLKDPLERGESINEQEMECTFNGRGSIPVSVSATRIATPDGRPVGSVIILRDLGEIRRLQEEVRRNEKLAALGGMAAGVAHEIRNPLSSIKGIATYFGSKFKEGSDDRQAAGVMVQEVDRLNRVITELLDFARPAELNLKPTDVGELLTHSVRLIEPDVKAKGIAIDLQLPEEDISISMDPDRFSQCLLNLYLNAVQAMDGGGVLTVKARRENDRMRFEIADTGNGIALGDLKKIFDPYFTTKPSGTGLGLAIVHKIIEAHQGRIQVRSTPGAGTTFIVVLPAAGDEAASGIRE
jgi:two-component system sensor histidine kinase HydH